MAEKYFSDLTETFLSLDSRDGGAIETVAGGDKFWSLPKEELEKFGESWLITEFYFDEDWQSWEMHPNGEEIVYLLSGSMNLILEKENSQKTVELRGKGLVVIPRGTWHTAKVFEPSNMLVVTRGERTEVRRV